MLIFAHVITNNKTDVEIRLSKPNQSGVGIQVDYSMKKEEILALFKSYEDAVCMIDETECWSARDLQKLFGYSLWQNFTNVIAKAKEACTNVGQNVIDHFIDVNKKVEVGSGAFREIDDVMLTRYACYLVAQNGDPRKPQIAYENFVPLNNSKECKSRVVKRMEINKKQETCFIN